MGLFNRTKKKQNHDRDNPYLDMRSMAFSTSAELLGIAIEPKNSKLYGVIIEWEMSGATITLVTFLSGDTSLYLSNGGGFIGAGQHEDVNELVRNFVENSVAVLEKAQPNDSLALPSNGNIVFHFLTSTGKFKITEKMSAIENQSSEYASYFNFANHVISAIRIATERKP